MATAEELGVENVLELLTETFGLDGEIRRNDFYILCPHPDHDDNSPSCHVSLKDGVWNCWSCPARGDLVTLGSYVLNQRRRDVFDLLRPNQPDAIRAGLERRLQAARKAARTVRAPRVRQSVLVPPTGSYDDEPLDSLRKRGFKNRTLREFGVRFAPRVTLLRSEERDESRSFELTNAIAIPILSERGSMLAWCYRATDDSERWFRNVRYIYTPGIQDTLNQTWFGLDKWRDSQEVVVVEGALDAMWCAQHGIPAVAILGSQVKQSTKVRKLMNFRKVTILTDRDSAGVTTAFGLGEALQERGVGTMVARYASWMLNRKGEPAKDAQDLCGLDLELVLARAIPFLLWKQAGITAA